MEEKRLRILLLDDERAMREPLKSALQRSFGYQVDVAATAEGALLLVAEAGGQYDVALLDATLVPVNGNAQDGVDVMETIRSYYPNIECIIFTGYGDEETRHRALKAGAFRYVQKPFDLRELGTLIRIAGQQVRLQQIEHSILEMQDLDQVLDSVVKAACSLTLADDAAIVLVDATTGRCDIHTRTSESAAQFGRHLKGVRLSRRIVTTGRVERVLETTTDPRIHPDLLEASIRTFVGVPIPGEARNQGVIYIYSHDSGRFDEWGTVVVLQTLADLAGMAIHNARVYGQINRRAGHMAALVAAGQGLTRAKTVEAQMEHISRFVRHQLARPEFFVALYDSVTDVLHFPLAFDHGKPVKVLDRRLGDDRRTWGIAGLVIHTGQECDWGTREGLETLCASEGIEVVPAGDGPMVQSGFCLPLKVGEQVIGVLSVQSYDRRAFDDDWMATCRALASQLSVALENARLLGELGQRIDQATEVQNYIQSLHDASGAIIASDDPKQVLQSVVDAVCERIRGLRCLILLPDEHGHFQTLVQSACGFEDRINPATDIRPQGVSRRVLTSGEPEFFPSTWAMQHKLNRKLLEQEIVSAACLPLALRGKTIGVLWVEFFNPCDFADAVQHALLTYANQAAIAYDAALQRRAQEALQARLVTAQDGITLAAQAVAAADLDAALCAIVEQAKRVLYADSVVLYPYDESTGKFAHPPTMIGVQHEEPILLPGNIRRGAVPWKILELESIHYAQDAQNDEYMAGRFVRDEGVVSSIGVPLRYGRYRVGAMFVNYRSRHEFSEHDRTNTTLFANQAAVAVRNAQLTDRLRRKAENLQSLYEAGKLVTGSLGIADILRQICVQAWELCGKHGKPACLSQIALKRGTRLCFEPAHVPDPSSTWHIPVHEIDLEGDRVGITGRAILSKVAQLVADVGNNGDYIEACHHSRSELAVPILLDGEAIGVIDVQHPEVGAFDQEDQEMLEFLAEQAAIAIRNARQYEELRNVRNRAESSTALAYMGMASSAWQHRAHSKVATIEGQLKLLRQHLRTLLLDSEQYPKLVERLDVIQRACEGLNIQPIGARLSNEDKQATLVPLNELIGERVDQLWSKEPYRDLQREVSLSLENSVAVRASPEWLREAFNIVMENAAKAAAEGMCKQVLVITQPAERDGVRGAEIVVIDTGKGIPSEVRPYLFERIVPKTNEEPGLGMGLIVARLIVETYGGVIEPRTTGPQGTTMAIWLPIA